jgi:hypothetical protein
LVWDWGEDAVRTLLVGVARAAHGSRERGAPEIPAVDDGGTTAEFET